MITNTIKFPRFTGVRCLMLHYIQGDPNTVPKKYRTGYEEILKSSYFIKGDIGYLTIDESVAMKGKPHRGSRAKYGRALHTEAGRLPGKVYAWGSGGGWGNTHNVTLDRDVKVLIANSVDDSCALWDAEQEETSSDGDIGYLSDKYPYEEAIMMKSGEVHEIGIFTPHESLPVEKHTPRQFLRIVSSGVHGREWYFTHNKLMG